MGRGTSSSQEILYGEHASTRVAEPVIELTALQEVGLQAVAALMLKYPDAPGFESYDICEAGQPYRHDHQISLGPNTTGAIISGLVKKGLAVQTTSVRKGASGETTDQERGWRLTARGLDHAQLLGVQPFQPRRS